MTEYQFNYMKADRGSWEEWIIPELLVGVGERKGDDIVEQLAEATSGWTNVVLTMQVNGVPVNAEHFMEGLRSNFTSMVTREAKEAVMAANLPDLSDLESRIREATEGIVRERFAAIGVELDFDDPYR